MSGSWLKVSTPLFVIDVNDQVYNITMFSTVCTGQYYSDYPVTPLVGPHFLFTEINQKGVSQFVQNNSLLNSLLNSKA